MQFEVNGQTYFLNFVAGEGRWFLFKPTRHDVAAMPVVDDDACMLFAGDSVVSPGDRDIVN